MALKDSVDYNQSDLLKRLGSALFYGISSCVITILNKTLLTTYNFPSFLVLGLGQIIATIVVLYIGKQREYVTFPAIEKDIFKKLWPLPLFYVGNMLFGLGSTKDLSLPMFTALRQFSILMTMIAELYILGVKPNLKIQASVYFMTVGSLIAASSSLEFSIQGYTFILLNDCFTAMNGVYIKKKLDLKDIGKYGILFYNALTVVLPISLIAYSTGDLQKAWEFPKWNQFCFLLNFVISCVMGFVLMYSIVLCTHYNSALTTMIIGCIKNICVAYLGTFIGGDYVFSLVNFIGINICVLGSLFYSYVTFSSKADIEYKELSTENSSKMEERV